MLDGTVRTLTAPLLAQVHFKGPNVDQWREGATDLLRNHFRALATTFVHYSREECFDHIPRNKDHSKVPPPAMFTPPLHARSATLHCSLPSPPALRPA
jgi:hypothetical protein